MVRPVRRTYAVVVREADELLRGGCQRRHATALDGRVSAEWSRGPGSMARRPSDSVAPLRRSSACGDWKVVHWCRTQASSHNSQGVFDGGVDEALRHETGAQHSAVECTRARVSVRNVVAPTPQPEPASRLRSATMFSFVWSNSRCRRYVCDLSNVTPRQLGSEQKGRVLLL